MITLGNIALANLDPDHKVFRFIQALTTSTNTESLGSGSGFGKPSKFHG